MLTSSPDGVPVLEKRGVVARHFVLALGLIILVGTVLILTSRSGSSDRLVGAGSTFAHPLIQRASQAYQTAKADGGDWTPGSTAIDYEPVGSLGGIERLANPEVDFAVSDYPLSSEVAAKLGYVQFPIAVGGLAPAYNLGAAGSQPLRLSAAVLADIYLGRIANWSDPRIQAANPGVALPDLKIIVVHRADGSGSTLHWTRYLSSGSADWRNTVGAGALVNWPTGQDVRGGEEMAKAVGATAGGIGYLEAGQARRAGLSIALVENPQKKFVSVTPASLEAAARGTDWAQAPSGAGPNVSDAEAYPIVTAIYVMMKRRNTSAQDNARVLRFIAFLLDRQGAEAKRLGYLPLPDSAVGDVKQIWARDLKHRS